MVLKMIVILIPAIVNKLYVCTNFNSFSSVIYIENCVTVYYDYFYGL